ncbi:MAG: zinc-dependent metalloprotease [Pseudomonadota bacterium]
MRLTKNRSVLDLGWMPVLFRTIAGICAVFMFTANASAEDEDDEESKTIETTVEDYEKIEGLFDLYRDPENGDLYMEISEDQLKKDFIAFTYTENGVLEAGHFRGAYRDQRILAFEKYYGRIEVVEKNTSFYFDDENPITRARNANVSDGILAALTIKATTEAEDDEGTDRYLVSANSLFLNERLHRVSPVFGPFSSPFAFAPGELAGDRTKFAHIRNYPANTDFVIDYVYSNPTPSFFTSAAVTDSRSVTIQVQHSLIEMPDEGFEPRIDDYRVGYFFDQVTDLTSMEPANYRDLINRWRLKKKDPGAEISDPVKPITWWIENTTPLEWRDTIRDAVLAWNQSFEKAGFSNAIEVKVQPDDAEWDAGDIRYNVLRWTSSPIPPFGGYGPSFTNPRTGEIIGADIMLEYIFVTFRQATDGVFPQDMTATGAPWSKWVPGQDFRDHGHDHGGEGQTADEELSTWQSAIAKNMRGKHIACSGGHQLHMSNLFGSAVLQAEGASESDIKEIVRQGLYYLLLHEVGHTLGLNHNMKASSLHGPREVHDPSVTQGAPTGSVMDYPAVNIAPLGVQQGDYYMQRPGPYDDWAIEFGYRSSLDDPEAEAARVEALLAKSANPENTFGNDADDMRFPGVGIDPRVMIGDMSSDPVAYGIDRIELVQATLPKLVARFDDEESWEDLTQAYNIALGQHAAMAGIMARQVGGVYVERIAPGQTDTPPFTPVPVETQKAAIDALSKYVYAADAFQIPDTLAERLQYQRRGFQFFGGTEDPKLHQIVYGIQMGTLSHLLNPVVLQRLVDSEQYGGNYKPVEVISDLNEAIFGGDLLGASNDYRRNLQIGYTQYLVWIANNPFYPPTVQGAALAGIDNLKGRLGLFGLTLTPEAKAHRRHLMKLLRYV